MKTTMFKITAISLLLVGSLSSCEEKEKGEEIPFIEIWRCIELCKDGCDKQNRVISSQEEWETFLTDVDLESCRRWADDSPWDFFSKMENDFDVYQRIVAIDVLGTPCGKGFEITKITDYPKKVVVTVTETVSKGAIDFGYCQHHHIVKIPVTNKRIEFNHIIKQKK